MTTMAPPLAATQSPPAPRLAHDDADYTRLHVATVRRLTRSVRQLVRDLEHAGSDDGERVRVATAFIHRHTALLGTAYEQAHKEGMRDYWGGVSLKQRGQPMPPPSTDRVRQRLAYYAVVSCAKMAYEALTTHRKQQSFADAVTLTDCTDLVDWQDSLGARLDLQAEITWSGLNDGATDGGMADPANPYGALWWVLGVAKEHCEQCPLYAAASPYDPPWTGGGIGGNQLNATPGDGHTDCGAACKCSLTFETPSSGAQWNALYEGLASLYESDPTAFAGFVDQAMAAGVQEGEPLLPDEVPSQAVLVDGQKQALDLYRATVTAWEEWRGLWPPMPDLMGASGDFFAALPAWDFLSPKQQSLIDQALEAVLLWGAATRNFMAGTGGETFSNETFADVERGMLLYGVNRLPNGRYTYGGLGGAGSAGGGAGKGAAKGAGGGGGGGGGAPKAAKAASASKSTKAPAAPKAGAKAKAGKAAAVTKAAAAKPTKQPTVAELKKAGELRVATATTQARRAEREYRAAEKVAIAKRATNGAEINRLSNERHQAFMKEFESHGAVRDLVVEERAHANGLAGKAPASYAKMLAAKQPMEEARATHAAAAAKAEASKTHADTLENRYAAHYNLSKFGEFERMRKEHPDYNAAERQSWKDSSAADKAKYAMWRKEGTYKAARDTVAGNTGVKGKAAFEAAFEAHPTRIAAKAALAAADARLGEATGETAKYAAFRARESARSELKDAQMALAHPTWKYPLHSAPTVHAQYTHPDQFPAGTLSAARAADPSHMIDHHAGDRALAELQHAQRFDGKPDIVTEAQLNAHVKAGEVELWRGDTKPGHTDNFMMGEHHAGIGVHGSGTYTALASAGGQVVARTYAKSGTNNGLIMRMSVKSDARVIEYDHLKELAHQAGQHADRAEQTARASGDRNALAKAETLKWLTSGGSERGFSRYAVTLGYDAINVNTSRTLKGQWIILNRTALRVSHQVRGD